MVIWAEIARYTSQEEGCYSIPDITLPKQWDFSNDFSNIVLAQTDELMNENAS